MSSSSADNPFRAELPLSARQVAELFPFHIVFDRDMRVCQVGSSLARVLPELAPGADLTEVFGLERPLIPFRFEAIVAHLDSLFLIGVPDGKLRLRGQMAPLPGNEKIAFLCSPWLTEPGDFKAAGLTYDDFPLHDSMPEFITVLQSERLGMEDLRKLSERLRQQREALKEANEKLVAQSAESKKLALIAARTDNGVVVTDAQGRIEWVNQAFEQITGFTPEEMKGRTPGSLLQGPDTDPATVAYMRRQLGNGEGFTCELVNYNKEGRKYWVEMEVQPIRGEDGSVTNFMAIESDVTARKDSDFRRNLAYAVTTILAEATDIQLALHKILQTIVESLGYQFGVVWRLTPVTGKLTPVRIWSPPHLRRSWFESATRSIAFERGVGLAGTVLELNGAVWVPDIRTTKNLPRAEAAQKDNLKSGFAFPIQVGGEARGVMEFFSAGSEEPEEELQRTLTAMGNQIGQFMERQDAEAERRRLVSLLHSTLESTADGIAVVDLDERFVAWNQRFLLIWGMPASVLEGKREDAIAHAVKLLVQPEEFTKRLNWWSAHPKESGEETIHFRDGRVFRLATQPQMAEGEVIGRVLSYRDITASWTAEQALRESEERYRVISSTVSDGIVTVNRRNEILFANEAAERIFDYPSGGLKGRQLLDIMGSEYRGMGPRSLTQVMRRSLVHGSGKPTEVQGRRRGGEEIPVELSFGKSHLRGERVITGTIRDITERRQAEQKFLQSMLEIEMANRAKSDFLASISHEIRTPLNSIAGLTELLRGTRLDDDQRDMVNTVWAGSESLLNLVNDLLDFSKIEAGQIENATVEFDPLAVCERALEIANSRAKQKGIALVCTASPGPPPEVLGDANRISQILLNLIVNGVKFTESGSVTVELHWLRAPNGWVLIDFTVRDTGIGIPIHHRARIFEKFYRVDTPVGRRAGGTGLGLSIARLLAEGMGGRLTLEPETDTGSCFRLSLELPALHSDGRSKPVETDRRVAILLSGKETSALLKKAWSSVGLEVIPFHDLSAACEYLDADRPCDLALLDGAATFEDAELKHFFRLLSLRGRTRCIRIRPPQSADKSPAELPGRVATIDFPLTPGRMSAALRRLIDHDNAGSADEEPGGAPPVKEAARPSRILLVEDNPDSQAYAARVFHKAGHHVTIAESVAETLRLAKTRDFDIVFMDAMLPDGNGFDAARQIRDHERSAGLERMPIVALTANAMREYRDRAFEADMDDYLTKPVRPEQLLRATREWSAAPPLEPVQEALQIDPDLADLVPDYLVRVTENLTEIQRLADTGDCPGICRIAHDLKGSGGAFGFPEITRLAREIENAGKSGNSGEARETAGTLAEYLRAVRWVPAPE